MNETQRRPLERQEGIRRLRELLDKRFDDRDICFTVWDGILSWRDHLCSSTKGRRTKEGYLSGISQLSKQGLLDYTTALPDITPEWRETIKRRIARTEWTEKTKHYRRNALSSLCFFLSTWRPNILRDRPLNTPPRDAIPSILSVYNDRVEGVTLSTEKWVRLLEALWERNERDALITSLMLLTGAPLSEILELRADDVKKEVIVFEKRGEAHVDTWLTSRLKLLRKGRGGHLFVTSQDRPLRCNQVTRALTTLSKAVGTHITPKTVQSLGVLVKKFNTKEKTANFTKKETKEFDSNLCKA